MESLLYVKVCDCKICIIVFVCLAALLVALLIIPSTHNQKVGQAAEVTETYLKGVTTNAAEVIANFKKGKIVENSTWNEKTLTYFDGTTNKLEEVQNTNAETRNTSLEYLTTNYPSFVTEKGTVNINALDKNTVTEVITLPNKELNIQYNNAYGLMGATDKEFNTNNNNFKNALTNTINKYNDRHNQINGQ